MQNYWSENIPTEIAGPSSVPIDFSYRGWNGEKPEAELQKIYGWKISESVSCTQNTSDYFYLNMFICLKSHTYKGL